MNISQLMPSSAPLPPASAVPNKTVFQLFSSPIKRRAVMTNVRIAGTRTSDRMLGRGLTMRGTLARHWLQQYARILHGRCLHAFGYWPMATAKPLDIEVLKLTKSSASAWK